MTEDTYYQCPLCGNTEEFSVYASSWFPVDGEACVTGDYITGPEWDGEAPMMCKTTGCKFEAPADYFSGDLSLFFGAMFHGEKPFRHSQPFRSESIRGMKFLERSGKCSIYLAEGKHYELSSTQHEVTAHEWAAGMDKENHILVRIDGYEEIFWGVVVANDTWKDYCLTLLSQRGHLLADIISNLRKVHHVSEFKTEHQRLASARQPLYLPGHPPRLHCGLWKKLQFQNLSLPVKADLASRYLAGERIHTDAFEGFLVMRGIWNDLHDSVRTFIKTDMTTIERGGGFLSLPGKLSGLTKPERLQLMESAEHLAKTLENSFN